MNVAHTITGLRRRDGGPFRSVPGLARAQHELGAQVQVFSLDADESLPAANRPGLEFHPFARHWPASTGRSPAMWRALQGSPVEVVHHHGLWHRTLHYAARKAQADNVPLILSPRGMMMPWAWKHRRRKKALAAALLHPGAFKAVAGWHATSEEEAQVIRQLGFNQPVCIAPNGVTMPTPDELDAARATWWEAEPRLANHRVALFYSRFHAKKRLLECIDLWHEIAPRDWWLLLVGIPDQFSVSQLRRYITSSGADRHVSVFDGTTQPPPYAAADLLLLPSHSENFGMAVAESLAAGVPVLSTDGSPWAELNSKASGWCVPWTRFETALKRAVDLDPETLRSLGKNGRAWMERDFAWQHSAARLLGFYQAVRPRV